MSAYPHARFLSSAREPGQFPPDSGVEVAVAGRSNAGKSSAINAVLGRRQLARISKTPGRTQLVNFFDLDTGQRLVDLPGYGFARVPDSVRRHWGRLMEAYFSERRSLAGLVVVVDVRRGILSMDEQMLAWAHSNARPAHVLLTKADKLSRAAAGQALARARSALGGRATVQLFSATRGCGVDEARDRLHALLAGGS